MTDQDALVYACRIIENYALDVRTAIADGRLPPGYCQGCVYRNALADIDRIRQQPPRPRWAGEDV